MARINVLDKKTAELIAAGEVIERPSSVVKELVENSIDAGATNITIEIKNGGVRLIRITDNGCGIEKDDMKKAFLRHATSKVASEEDLYNIGTLGFRGEALASVCAVSRVELVTRTPESPLGNSLKVEGGEYGEIVETGCPTGTTIYVRDLFYNIPARMKFLKKDVTEGNAIAALLDRLALSHPEISFKFIREGQTKLQSTGDGKLLSAIYAVYGRDFGSSLIPVMATVDQVNVTGYITKPESAKPTRSMEHFFINDRYVRSATAMAALEESYKNGIMVGKFPGCVLNISMPFAMVDVNVHPAKLEVKLTDERMVFQAVYSACKGALEKLCQSVSFLDTAGQNTKAKLSYMDLVNKPLVGEQQKISLQEYRNKFMEPSQNHMTLSDNSVVEKYNAQLHKIFENPSTTGSKGTQSIQNEQSASDFDQNVAISASLEEKLKIDSPLKANSIQHDMQDFTKMQRQATSVATTLPDEARRLDIHSSTEVALTDSHTEPLEYKLIGEVFQTYILAQQGEQLLLVDKHAAHERILFNRLQDEYQRSGVSRQILLESMSLSFSKDLYDIILQNCDIFASMGFVIENFGSGSIIIREIPALLNTGEVEDIIIETAEKLLKGIETSFTEKTTDLLHSMACKAAVKGGSFTGVVEQKKLLELLQKDSAIRSCPHGRPIMISITKKEVEKMFGRLG